MITALCVTAALMLTPAADTPSPVKKGQKVGMGWVIQKELRATGTPKAKAVAIGEILRDTQMNRWAPYYQSMGFWLVWDHGKGATHWPTRRGC